MTSFRTATTTADTSGASFFQRAFLDESGAIVSFDGSVGKLEVEKYWNPTALEVIYQKIIRKIFAVEISTTNLYESQDAKEYRSIESSGLGFYGIPAPPQKAGSRYFVAAQDGYAFYIYYSDDFANWTKKEEIGGLTSFSAYGSNIVALSDNLGKIKYSSDSGATWTESGTIGASVYVGCMMFSNGKVGLLFGDTSNDPDVQPKVKILSNFNDTTGTDYAIGSRFDGGDQFWGGSRLLTDGTYGYFIICEDNTSQNILYKIDASGNYSAVASGADDRGQRDYYLTKAQGKIFAWSQGMLEAVITDSTTFSPPDPTGSYFSLPFEFAGKLYVQFATSGGGGGWGGGGQVYRLYVSEDEGANWVAVDENFESEIDLSRIHFFINDNS
jgi:hypothetical protein